MITDRVLGFFGFSRKIRKTTLRGNGNGKGQATTEFVLLLPLFVFFLIAFAKTFAILVLVQKMEIASYYAARRWQLESHRNITYAGPSGSDFSELLPDIKKKVRTYLYDDNEERRNFLGIKYVDITVERTQVWNIVTLTVQMNEVDIKVKKIRLNDFKITKYVPNRDRPIQFVLPGLN